MSDITYRLRLHADNKTKSAMQCDGMQAADEIERLREQLRIAVADIDSLHAELSNGQQLPDPTHPDQCRMCGERSEQARQMNQQRRLGPQ